MLIASKVEEVQQIDVEDLSRMTADAVSNAAVLYWESAILCRLDYDTNGLCPLLFLNEYLYRSGCPSLKDYTVQTKNLSPNGNRAGTSTPTRNSSSSGAVVSPLPLYCGDNIDHVGRLLLGATGSKSSPAPPWSPMYAEAKGMTVYESCSAYICEVCMMHHRSLVLPSHLLAAAALLTSITIIHNLAPRLSNLPKTILDLVLPPERPLLREALASVCAIMIELEMQRPARTWRLQVAAADQLVQKMFHQNIEEDDLADECRQEVVGEVAAHPIHFKKHRDVSQKLKESLVDFARDVDAKHKDACIYMSSVLDRWLSTRFQET
eukprot:Lankesteria_metandrocarpae@DN5256_c1_g2_i4.p1